MPKGNNYPATVNAAALAQASKATADLKKALAFVPNLSTDVKSTASISPERLGLADKAIEVAAAAPEILRKALDPQRLIDKTAYYRALNGLENELNTQLTKLQNARNVLGADMMFDIGNIHEDVETDNGETVDLGPLRAELHDYYIHPKARKKGKGGPAAPGQ